MSPTFSTGWLARSDGRPLSGSGVNHALTTEEWVRRYLQGYVRLSRHRADPKRAQTGQLPSCICQRSHSA